MIAPLKQPLRTELPQQPLAGSLPGAGDSQLGVLIALTAFFSLVPYPALAIGNTSALQIGNALMMLLLVPCITMAWNRRAYFVFPVLLLPLCFSIVKVTLLGEGDPGLAFKTSVVWVVSGAAVLFAQVYGPAYALDMLTGFALATVLHAIVGLWQFVSFSHGQFPLVELYHNPSFLSVQDNARTIAKWTRRPFGIFPEPSAMSSSLAPWVLFWFAEALGLIRLRQRPAPWQRTLFVIAGLSGLVLIILSQSGHAAFTMAALGLFGVTWFLRCRATMRTFVALVFVFGVLAPLLLWFAATSLSNRVGGAELGNSSWEERTTSLIVGFNLFVSRGMTTVLLGIGAGMSAPLQWNLARLDAVFSVLLTYIYETGLVGVAAVSWVAHLVAGVWKASRYSVVFACVLGVWVVGITLTTSYQQLLSLWLTLGWLTIWPSICETMTAARSGLASPSDWMGPACPRRLEWKPVAAPGAPAQVIEPGEPRGWGKEVGHD